MAWLTTNPTSPVTRTPLRASQLVPNRSLAELINGGGEDVTILPPTPPASSAAAIAPHAQPTLSAMVSLNSATLALIHPNHPNALSVTVHPPASTAATRTPSHIVLVIDVSGSMNSPATTKDSTESSGLSILDITKHAAKTVVNLLDDNDKLTVIQFHDAATKLMTAVPMNAMNRATAISKIDALVPLNCTNLWDGLVTAMNAVKNDVTPNMLASIFLLTDGIPNVEPPRGHLPMLKMFQDENPDINFTVNTFGFGYNLKSDLLLDIAKATGGNYSFIPDASFVGTVFVHAASNALSTFGQGAILDIELPSSDEAIVLGSALNSQLEHKKTSWGIQIEVGAISYDQDRTFVVLLPKDVTGVAAPLFKLSFFDVDSGNTTVSNDVLASAPANNLELLRLAAVDAISTNLSGGVSGGCNIQTVVDAIKNAADAERSGVGPLLVDMSGQVTEAFSKAEYFSKWGKHYLPAIARAHLLQLCTNFKDPGMQSYGGRAFEALRDAADKIFMSMPAPTPSRRVIDASGASCRASVMSSSAYSRSYYNSSNACFAGDCIVTMADGSYKLVWHVKKGDVIMTPGGGSATVACVVKTLTENGRCDLVQLDNGLKSTPYHPIMWNGVWTFPKDIKAIEKNASCHAVFSFVMENREPAMIINDVACITLAHGVEGDAVASHAYFGTESIVKDLKKFSGAWKRGLVVLDYGAMARVAGGNPGFDSMIYGIYPERVIDIETYV
jgi:Mg-chelatase subunit ChlD